MPDPTASGAMLLEAQGGPGRGAGGQRARRLRPQKLRGGPGGWAASVRRRTSRAERARRVTGLNFLRAGSWGHSLQVS